MHVYSHMFRKRYIRISETGSHTGRKLDEYEWHTEKNPI